MSKSGTTKRENPRRAAGKAPKAGPTPKKNSPLFEAESLGFYRYLIDNIADAVVVNASANRVFVNDAYLKLYGVSSTKEALERPPREFVIPEDLHIIEARNKARLEGKPTAERYEFRLRRKNGEVRTVEVSSVPILWDGVPASLAILRDITERKVHEQGMAQLTSIVESTGDAVFSFNLKGEVTTWNPGAARLYGYAPPEVIGKHVNMVTMQEPTSDFQEKLGLLLKNEYLMFENIHIKKDGTKFNVAITSSLIRDPKGQIIGISSINRDISTIKTMEAELRHAQKMEAVGRLAGSLAHDFNNLLTPIMGFAELGLQDAKPNEPATDYFNEITRAAENARDITRQLMSFSYKKVMDPKTFNLNDLVSQILPLIESAVGESIKVRASLAHDAWPIKADPAEVQQVLMNLIVNSKDAMPDGGSLVISTINQPSDAPTADGNLSPGSYVVLSVSDTGKGMSEEVRSRLFEPFFTTKEKEVRRGVGLSLATSYAIAKQYGGIITADSKPGYGTNMKVFLPAAQFVTAEAAPNKTNETPRGTESVLLVEDDDGVRKITAQMLKRLGYIVTEAENGKDALSIVRKRGTPFDIVLTDFVMPEMNGKKLAEQLNKLFPASNILFMSGYVDDPIASAELAAESNKLLRKPFGLQALALKMREALDKQS